MNQDRILVVDDERSMREFLAILLKKEGFAVDTVGTVARAREAVEQAAYDLVITDLKLPDGTGIEVLAAVRDCDPDTEVLVITAFGTAESAVEAMKLGAYDYLSKPFKVGEIKLTVRKALEKSGLARENRELRRQLDAARPDDAILGRSPPLQEVFRVLERVAPTRVTVLVCGESGTGKELVARRLHALSGRPGPFVAVNCSAIPEGLIESELFGHVKGSFTGAVSDKAGLFEEAAGGTLFLDEVGELPLHLQPKLLRALQEGRIKRVGDARERAVDVRIVSATNRNLKKAVAQGTFREDLYYRLNVVAIEIPSLARRREDIPLLAQHFLLKYARAFDRPVRGFDRAAMEALERYDYPGNVRELENIVERAVALETGELLGCASLPEAVVAGPEADPPVLEPLPPEGIDLERVLEDVERRYVTEALERTGGNRTEAARLLGISFRSIRYRLDKLGRSP